MERLWIVILTMVCALSGRAQDYSTDSTAALTYSRAVNVPLNALQLFDQASAAWTWTFGKEPGAKVLRSDREQGVIEGIARFNFRSTHLPMREESMGTVQYRVMIHLRAGECRVVVSELNHSGNPNTLRGGVHLGVLDRSSMPRNRVGGQGRNNVIRLYADVKEQSSGRINTVLQAFASRLRASAEP